MLGRAGSWINGGGGGGSGGLLTSARFWYYQDFAAGAGPALTITQNENGTGGTWVVGNIVNGSAVVTTQSGEPIYDNAAALPVDLVKVQSHVGDAVVLNSTPAVGQGPVRIWYLYATAADQAAEDMEIAPRFVKEERSEFLDARYLNDALNLSDLPDVDAALTNLGFTDQAAGNVLLGDGLKNFTSDADLFFDISNTRLGVGTNTPGQTLDVSSDTNPTILLRTQSTSIPDLRFQAARAANANLQNGDDIGQLSFFGRNAGATNEMVNVFAEYTGDGTTRTADFVIEASNAGAPAERLRLSGAGLLTVGAASVSQAGVVDAVGVHVSSYLAVTETGGGTDTVSILGPAAVTSSYSIYLPGTQGAAGTTLINDSAGNLTWATAGTGAVDPGTAGRLALYPATGDTVDDIYVQNANNISVVIDAHSSLATARSYTIPDAGDSAFFIMGEGDQSINGSKTFSLAAIFNGGIALTETGGGSDTVTVNAAAASAAYAIVLPDAQGGAGTTLINNGSGALSWGQGITYKAGDVNLSATALSVAVTFATAMASANYTPTCSFRNTVDADPVYQPYTIIAQSTAGFTVEWNDPIQGSNVELLWQVVSHYDP